MKPLLLTVDSGNTHVKWGLYDGQQLAETRGDGQGNKELAGARMGVLEEPSRIMVSNVADAQAKVIFPSYLSRWKTRAGMDNRGAYQCGVRNYYAGPAQLGSDRWAALIAAWESNGRVAWSWMPGPP